MKGTYSQLKLALKPLGESKQNRNQIKFDCPVCLKSGTGIDKYNLEVKFIEQGKGMFNCWACGYKGTVYKLIKDFGKKEYKDLFKIEREGDFSKDNKVKQIFELPPKITSVFRDKKALSCLYQRGLIDDIITHYKVKISLEQNNIIFPVYNHREDLTSYITYNYNSKSYKVYKDREKFICFNENNIDKNIPIILTEGIFDCLVVNNAIPLLGTNINDKLLEFLSSCKIIFALDNDLLKKKYKSIIKQLLSVDCEIDFLEIPNNFKDINEFYCLDKPLLINNLKTCYNNFLFNLKEETIYEEITIS